MPLENRVFLEVSAPEVEEPIPLTSEDNEQQVLLKKDIEKFDNSDLGNLSAEQ